MHSVTLLGRDPEIMSWSAFILICLESGSIFVTSLQWQRAHAIILMGLHVSTQFIPPAAPHLCLPLLTLGDSHFL